jgi:type II secretory pathway pseudopilin PulG
MRRKEKKKQQQQQQQQRQQQQQQQQQQQLPSRFPFALTLARAIDAHVTLCPTATLQLRGFPPISALDESF